eukprot:2540653-Pyramimonas_sp.AAC.1
MFQRWRRSRQEPSWPLPARLITVSCLGQLNFRTRPGRIHRRHGVTQRFGPSSPTLLHDWTNRVQPFAAGSSALVTSSSGVVQDLVKVVQRFRRPSSRAVQD